MNIISCENCGILIDTGRLFFPPESRLVKDDGEIDEALAVWDDNEANFVPYLLCPVCACVITE